MPCSHVKDTVRALTQALAHQVTVQCREQSQREQNDKQERSQQLGAQRVLARNHDADDQQQQAGHDQN